MKKIWLKLLPMVANFMQFDPKSQEPLNFSDEQKEKLDKHANQEGFAEAFMKHFNEEHLQANEQALEAYNDFMKQFNASNPPVEGSGDEDEPNAELPTTDEKSVGAALQSLVQKAEGLIKTNAQLAADNKKLKDLPEDDVPEAIIEMNPNNTKAVKHSKTHLFASNQSYDSLDRPWNKNVVDAQNGTLKPGASTNWNKVNIDKLNEDLGAYSRRNSNEILDLFMDGYDIPEYWEVISNIQDQHVFTSIATGDITQAFKKGWLPKNKQRFVPIINKIFDKQIDVTWEASELKSIEKSWLNMFFNEGSTPYKDSFALFLFKKLMAKARKEDKISIFTGVYSDPEIQPGVAGHFKNSMDGFLKKIQDNRGVTYKPHDLPKLTPSNTYDVLKKWCNEQLPIDIRTSPLKLGLGEDVHKWYIDGREAAKGTITDYKKETHYVEGRTNIEFETHKQLEGTGFVYITTDDNVGLMVDVLGEEERLTVEKSKREINAFADWKLGVYIKAFGAKVDANAPMTYEDQIFFSNNDELLTDVYVPVASNDATPSVSEHYALRIGGNNTSATDITNFDDVNNGDYIYLYGDADSNYSTVKNNANIILSDGDFELAKGNTMTLVASNGKLLEYSRTVASEVSLETKVQLAADATSVSAESGTWFVTNANTAATAFTNISDAIDGEVYTIEGGSDTDSTTIASGGNFLLTAAFTASNGAYIKVRYNGSKFVEVSRG